MSSASTGNKKTPSKAQVIEGTGSLHLGEYATQSVLRELSGLLTAEAIARIGVRWHNAHNKSVIASMIRNYIYHVDLGGIADSYDDMRKSSPAGEIAMIKRFLRTGQHAARQHRENDAKIVASLFKDTPTDPALVHVKKEVFGVEDGKAIMNNDHPAITKLLGLPKGDF